MAAGIEYFEIAGLHGHRHLNIPIEDNKIILVGENGTGKTTVLRLLYYCLSGQWNALRRHNFSSLAVGIGGARYEVTREQLGTGGERLDPRAVVTLPAELPRLVRELVLRRERGRSWTDLSPLFERDGTEAGTVLRHLLSEPDPPPKSRKELDRVRSQIGEALDCQFLYLPTYRRIEQEFSLIFDDAEEFERRHRQPRPRPGDKQTYTELIQFGMGDVERAVAETVARLKEFAREGLNTLTLGYLGDVVDGVYTRVDVSEIRRASDDTIESVLGRIEESILSAEQKRHLLELIHPVRRGDALTPHAMVICHYSLKLLHFQEQLRQKESRLSAFCVVCNEYLGQGKRFAYNSGTFSFGIEQVREGAGRAVIELRHLSSGEKQIVSLFSHLCLSEHPRHFVLIDEPELSLSVPWQRRFLQDVCNEDFCAGLVAATHSPFVYENSLERYAHGLGEFEVNG